MQFSEIVGQAHTRQLLQTIASSDRMPHALLLIGAPGAGGLALALATAKLILCEHPSDAREPCGTCSQCTKVEKLIHPDLHFSFPTVGAKATSGALMPQFRAAIAENPYLNVQQWLERIEAGNAQGNITKEECVEIVKKLSLKIFEGKRKILLMWLPEYLAKEGNRLLKLIEEPPDDTVFLLVAENAELILNTIVSRCQIVKVPPLQDSDIAQALIERGQTSGDAHTISHLVDGNFNNALTMIAQAQDDYANIFIDWMRKCFQGNPLELLNWTESFAKNGREAQKSMLRYGLHFLRELLILKVTQKTELRLQPNEQQTAMRMQNIIHWEMIDAMQKLLDECTFHIERNANPKILFLDTSIQLHKILKTPVR